jgi:hypothetical protein
VAALRLAGWAVLAVLAVVLNRKAQPSFVAQVLVVERGLVVAGVPDLLVVRKTITQSKAE